MMMMMMMMCDGVYARVELLTCGGQAFVDTARQVLSKVRQGSIDLNSVSMHGVASSRSRAYVLRAELWRPSYCRECCGPPLRSCHGIVSLSSITFIRCCWSPE
jgi:hypothetical protein